MVATLARSWRNQGNALQGLSLEGSIHIPFLFFVEDMIIGLDTCSNSRYVRTGTAASPHVLQILRKKIEQRLKLKELLGGDHVFFGGIKNIKASPSKAKKKL